MAGYGPLWETTDYSGGKLTATGYELQDIAERIKARLLIIDPRAAAYAAMKTTGRKCVRSFRTGTAGTGDSVCGADSGPPAEVRSQTEKARH